MVDLLENQDSSLALETELCHGFGCKPMRVTPGPVELTWNEIVFLENPGPGRKGCPSVLCTVMAPCHVLWAAQQTSHRMSLLGCRIVVFVIKLLLLKISSLYKCDFCFPARPWASCFPCLDYGILF